MNPYPLESELDKIFTTFKNVCIVLIADICREKLEFKKMLFTEILNEKNTFEEKRKQLLKLALDNPYLKTLI